MTTLNWNYSGRIGDISYWRLRNDSYEDAWIWRKVKDKENGFVLCGPDDKNTRETINPLMFKMRLSAKDITYITRIIKFDGEDHEGKMVERSIWFADEEDFMKAFDILTEASHHG